MNTTDQIQLPGIRQLCGAFMLLVLLLLTVDSALQWLSLSLHQQSLVATELFFLLHWPLVM
jgi:hypothetical protein